MSVLRVKWIEDTGPYHSIAVRLKPNLTFTAPSAPEESWKEEPIEMRQHHVPGTRNKMRVGQGSDGIVYIVRGRAFKDEALALVKELYLATTVTELNEML